MVDGIARVLKTRFDGWYNFLSGIGVAGKDKRASFDFEHTRFSETDLETLYAADDISAKIIDTLPEDALREWVEIKNMEQDLEDQVIEALDLLNSRQRLEEGWKWGRLYGGAGVYMSIDDGLDPQEPVNEERIYAITSLTVLSRYELIPFQINSNLDSPFFGEPEIYRLQTSQPTDFVERYIHHSRILRFDGVKLPRRLRIQNQWWGDSVLIRSYNAIRNYNACHDSSVAALQDFSVGVFQIKNLADLMASGQEDLVRKRLELINLSKSVIKSIVMDTDETFENKGKPLTGVPEVIMQANARLVVSSGMPHTKILGESPSGLGADGRSEDRNWYDYVKNQQKLVLRPRMDTLLKYIFLSKQGPTGGVIPDKWDYDFVPLWQMSDVEGAQMQLTVAQKDQIYIQTGVLDPDEVAKSRFGGEKYSLDTVIDLAARTSTASLMGSPSLRKLTPPKPETEDPKDVDPASDEATLGVKSLPAPGFVPRRDDDQPRALQSIVMKSKTGQHKVIRKRDPKGMNSFRSFAGPMPGVHMVYGNIEEDPTHESKESPHDEFAEHNENLGASWKWEGGKQCGPDGKGAVDGDEAPAETSAPAQN